MSSTAIKVAARDRVLMYTHGMDIDPETGVALALESLRRAGKDADPSMVMRELFNILQEKGQSSFMMDAGNPLSSTPPMNRRVMVAKDMVLLSFIEILRSWFLRLIRLFRI